MKKYHNAKSLPVLARGFMRYSNMLYFRYDILGEEHGRNTREIHERRMKADKEARAISERMKSLSWDITVLTLKGMGFDVSIYEQ